MELALEHSLGRYTPTKGRPGLCKEAWAAESFYRTELLIGVGQAFAFIGLVGCVVLQAIFTGGLAKPEWVLSFSAFFHVVRLFGGTSGATPMVAGNDPRCPMQDTNTAQRDVVGCPC